MYLGVIFALAWLVTAITAKVHTFHFNVTYVEANPDGLHPRRMIGINGQWPIPTIRVKKDDTVRIYVDNQLGDRNTSLHFHGLFQQGTNAMDGPEMVTQCPIPPGHTFLYDFKVQNQTGTYWYHSHSGSQYSDGLRGLFIIEDDDLQERLKYDEEVDLSVTDYYHEEAPMIMESFMSRYNPTGAEPIPQNSLFNESKNVSWSIKPDTTYFLRIVNMGMFTSQYIYIEDHTFTVVEIDGVEVEPQETDSLYITVAQRYGVLVHTKKSTDKNYRFVNIIDKEMLDFVPEDLELVSTNWMVYNEQKPMPKKLDFRSFERTIEQINPIDDFTLILAAKYPLLPDPDYQITLEFVMDNLGDGVTYALFNNKTYVPPKVPTLMTVMSSGEYAGIPQIYGSNTNSYVLQKDEVVEIVLNNMDPGKHPFHLHGHNFQVISRSKEGEEDDPIVYDPKNPDHNNFPEYPMIRDTAQVNANGFIVLRFKADNPGVWFFHCHVDWHLEQGLAITLVEAPFEMQTTQQIIPNHFDACTLGNISYYGNAAGNHGNSKQEWLDLSGENLQHKPLPEGFTTMGYIAMAMCTLVAIFGISSIYKYGIQDIHTEDTEIMIKKLYDIIHQYEN
jgi:iron transport multicopper oxidase